MMRETKSNKVEIQDKIKLLKERINMCEYQKKITTELSTVIEYEQEIEQIERKIEQLKYKLNKK